MNLSLLKIEPGEQSTVPDEDPLLVSVILLTPDKLLSFAHVFDVLSVAWQFVILILPKLGIFACALSITHSAVDPSKYSSYTFKAWCIVGSCGSSKCVNGI